MRSVILRESNDRPLYADEAVSRWEEGAIVAYLTAPDGKGTATLLRIDGLYGFAYSSESLRAPRKTGLKFSAATAVAAVKSALSKGREVKVFDSAREYFRFVLNTTTEDY